MTKRLLIALLALTMSAHITGCSTGGSSEDGEVAEANDETFAEEGEGDFADGGSDESSEESTDVAEESGDELPDEAPSGEESTETADAEAMPEDEGGDLDLGEGGDQLADGEMSSEEGDFGADPGAQAAAPTDGAEEELALDDGELSDEVVAGESAPTDVAAAPPTDEPLFSEGSASAEETPIVDSAVPSDSVVSNEVAKPVVSAPVVYSPLLKIRDSAFTANDGTTLNRVYLGRPNDTVKSVAIKLYGTDRSKDLRRWNPVLSRGVRTGDKIYYASPTNPSDNRMLTYYEEAGIPPQIYTTKDGDNIRTVSKNLLGFNDAWREVWSTNLQVESKGNVPAGIDLRYWSNEVATQPLAAAPNLNQPPPMDPLAPNGNTGLPPVDPTQPDPLAANPPPLGEPPVDPLAPPPPMDPTQVAQNDPLAPPPLPNDPTAPPPMDPTVGQVQPPAPPDAQQPPPNDPPAAPSDVKPVPKQPPPEMEEGMDPDMTMAIGLGGIALFAAAILFVFIRKNRARKMDLTQTTQV